MAFNSVPFQDYVPGWQRIWHGVRWGGSLCRKLTSEKPRTNCSNPNELRASTPYSQRSRQIRNSLNSNDLRQVPNQHVSELRQFGSRSRQARHRLLMTSSVRGTRNGCGREADVVYCVVAAVQAVGALYLRKKGDNLSSPLNASYPS